MISLLLVANHSTLYPRTISKMPPKGSPGKKKAKRGMKKAMKTLITMPTSDSDESQSILTQGALDGCLAGGSDEEDGHGGEGEEASKASHKRSRSEATVTSGAGYSLRPRIQGPRRRASSPQEKQCLWLTEHWQGTEAHELLCLPPDILWPDSQGV